MKKLLKDIVPPFLLRLLKPAPAYGYFHQYASWEEASKAASGYADTAILDKVKEAALRVQSGHAAFERDSILFYEEEVNWPLLASLLFAAAQNQGRLHLTDFGGSLASTYYQHRRWLDALPECVWSVVEQPHFVTFGKDNLSTNRLNFYDHVSEAPQRQVLLISSVLQYLSKPDDYLDAFLHEGYQYIIFDRLALTQGPDRLTLQKVNPEIYKASYPAWFFKEQRFLHKMSQHYQLTASWKNEEFSNDTSLYFKGFCFQRNALPVAADTSIS